LELALEEIGARPIAQGAPMLVGMAGARICAGFPSPADDYVEEALDPAQLIVTNPLATFLWRVAGSSMVDAGVQDGDIVVVDRSLTPRAGDVVVAVIDSQPSVKRLVKRGGRLALEFANRAMEPLVLDEAAEASIWGVVTWSLTRHRDMGA
jgi:DNA polymerase V